MKQRTAIYSLIFLLAMTVCGKNMKAQSLSDNGIFYHTFASPWSTSLNPAMFPKTARMYVTLPRINADLSLPFSYKELGLHYDAEREATIFNVNNLLNLLNERKCRFSFNTDAEVLGLGFSLGSRFHLTLNAGVKANGIVTLPVELTRLLTEGNLTGDRHLELGTTSIAHAMAYGYVSAGLSYQFPDLPLTLGGRLNVLDGIAVASVDNLKIDLTTAQDTSNLHLMIDYMAHSAGMAYVAIDTNNRPTFGTDMVFPKNLGFTFDLGAKFSFSNLDVSASILDLGPGIAWSQNTTTITPKDGSVELDFDGFQVESFQDPDYFKNYTDSLLNRLNFKAEDKSFTYAPPTKAYVGVSYTILNTLRVGYLFHGEWEGGWFHRNASGLFRCNNTLSAHVSLFDWIEVAAANSLSYDGESFSFFNPGLFVSINLAQSFQIYAAVDYISSFYLTEMRAAHAYFGINIYGHK